jgi:hypothetical protein
MPLLWIHRALATDLRVYFDTLAEAYEFGKKLLQMNSKNTEIAKYDEDLFIVTGSLKVGYSTNLQISVESDTFEPEYEEGWYYWNAEGCAVVTQEEAERLGEKKEPITE